MSRTDDPLRLEYGREVEGLAVVRQPPPPGAASFSATYVGPAGWGFDPPGQDGTALATNQLLSSGAGPYDRMALARLLDRAGASLSTECAPESAEVTIWGPSADWEKLLALLADVVLRPRFAPDDLVRVQRQFSERQMRELAQPASRADRELFRATYPEGHPYRSTGLGDPRSVARISPRKLRALPPRTTFARNAAGYSGSERAIESPPMRISTCERPSSSTVRVRALRDRTGEKWSVGPRFSANSEKRARAAFSMAESPPGAVTTRTASPLV